MQKDKKTRLKIVKRKSNEKTSLIFYGELTIYTVSKLKRFLHSIIKQSRSILIELSGVDKMDSAGLQLLLSSRKACLKNNISFEITKIGDEAQRLINLYRITL